MSNQHNKNKVENNSTIDISKKQDNKFKLRDFVNIIIGLVIGIMISYCIFNLTFSSAIQKLETSTQTVNTDTDTDVQYDKITGISTYEDPNTIISDKDKIAIAQENMMQYINGITDGSTYSQVMVGDNQYVYYMYNSKGEIFTQDVNATYTEVFLKNKKVFRYTTDEQILSVGSDIDIASIFKNAVNAIGNDNVTLYEMDLSEVEAPEGHDYRIDLVGEDAVKLLYSSMGDEFATDMVNSIADSIDGWEPHIIMAMFIAEDRKESYCYCLYVIDDCEYTNWFFQGYDTVTDWALDEGWYTYDSESDESGEIYANLINTLVENINNVMVDYAIDMGWAEEQEVTNENND